MKGHERDHMGPGLRGGLGMSGLSPQIIKSGRNAFHEERAGQEEAEHSASVFGVRRLAQDGGGGEHSSHRVPARVPAGAG